MRLSAHPDVVAFLSGRHDASEEASAGAPIEQGVLDGA
jgi:hypothetical protein